MRKIYLKLLTFVFIIFFAQGCTKDWVELNTDPNNPVDAPVTNVFGHAIRVAGGAFYDDWQGMNNFCSYAGQITKIQYTDESHYQYRDNVVYAAWSNYFQTQLDLAKIRQKAQENGFNQTEGAILTWSVFLWQMAVDQWGDIPYSEALMAESGDMNPKYDAAVDIYTDLLNKIEEANTLLAQPNAADDLGGGDFIYGGDFEKWRKFANSIHLRLATRISNANENAAKKEIEKILQNPTLYPIFESRNDEAKLKWQGTNPYQEPYYYNKYVSNRDDHAMAKTMIDTLLSFNDPRIAAFAKPNGDGIYVGQVEGAQSGNMNSSRIGAMYRDDPYGYTYFMRYAEVQFIIAEAANKAWNTGGITTETAYENGISASFLETFMNPMSPLYGSNMADSLSAYLANPKVALGTGMLENQTKIYVQKWLSMFKEGQEIWALQRRTDFPPMPAAPASTYPGHNRGPFRYPYPQTEFNLNGSNIEPAAEGIVDHFWGKQIFWDTRTGVH